MNQVGIGIGSKRDAVVDISFRELWDIVKRRMLVAAIIAVLVSVTVFVLAMRQTPRYDSEALVMIDRSERELVDSPMSDIQRSDSTMVDTEVEVLRSRKLARRVAENLDLFESEEFRKSKPGGVARIIQGASGLVSDIFGPTSDSELYLNTEQLAEQQRNASIDKLLGTTSVRRNGLTFVIAIRARTRDPVLSAAIANEYADQYVLNQVQSKFDSSQMLNTWVAERLDELRQEVATAEEAVDGFRQTAGLLNVSGSDIVERQIVEQSNEVAALRRRLEDSEAKLEIARASQQSESLSPVLTSDRIIDLREQESRILDEVSKVRSTLGPMHPDYLTVENRLQVVQRELINEIDRIVASLENDVSTHRRGLEASERRLAALQSQAVRNNSSILRLTELQRQSEAARSMYEQFLARNQELTAITNLEQPGAQVLSEAVIPSAPASPNPRLQFAIALLFGAMMGVASIVGREVFESRFLAPADLERTTGISCLTTIPETRSGRALHLDVAEKPFSYLTECIRRILTDLDLKIGAPMGRCNVVAVVAAGPQEGKPGVSLGLAIVAKNSGSRRILIVDADLRKNTLTKLLGMPASNGLQQVLAGEISVSEALQRSPEFGFDVLTSDFSEDYPAIVNEQAVQDLLQQLREDYDLIIIDTAPMLAISETRFFVRFADEIVALVRWRRTKQDDVREMLKSLQHLGKNPDSLILTNYSRKTGIYSANQTYYSERI